ncbi:MAG TPA: hypothetical protein VIP46_20060 [Pyrinomonadaceae bacterium]
MINLQNKVLPVALGAALLGGTVGALVMRGKAEQPETRVAAANLLPASQTAGSQAAALRYNDATAVPVAANNEATPVALNSENQPTDESCYRAGFTDGFEAARKEAASLSEQSVARSAAPQRVVYRNAPAARRARSSRSARTVYYDYQQPRKRSFWSKHRDKLTVAGGAGVGALIGGLTGGKKGALIGAGVGGGGAAVYTYGIRKRNRY